MKTLIAYATKSGTSREAALLLASQLAAHEVTTADLAAETPDPAAFDYVVLGGAIRMGKLPRAARAYLKKYAASLAGKPHTLFLCCAAADQFENYAERVYPPNVLDSAEETVYFGGQLDPRRQRGLFDKTVARMMRNAILSSEDHDAALPGFLPEHVRLLAGRLSGR